MSDRRIQLVGGPCGSHGSYVFYKAFAFSCGGRRRALALGEFFFVQLWPARPEEVCVGELQLVFEDGGERLASLRLYFLPEHTPDGRLESHGEHEILAVQEKLTVRLEDLADVVVRAPPWAAGWAAGGAHDAAAPAAALCTAAAPTAARLALADIEKAKRNIGDTIGADEPCALVLSYDHYCRLRGLLKRLESVSSRVYRHAVVKALGGVQIPSRETRLLYCRDVFDYPELDGHEIFCNHLAPKLRGRSRKKARREGSSPSSESTSDTDTSQAHIPSPVVRVAAVPAGLSRKPTLMRGLAPSRPPPHRLRSVRWGEKEFIQRLHNFMTQRGMTVNRMPSWGMQNLNLYRFYRRVQQLGGYQAVTVRRLWKQVFDEMGGDPSNTAAATCCRRLFERVCLAFERYDRGLPEPHTGVRARPSAAPPQQQRGRRPGAAPAAPALGGGGAMLTALAQTRPSITITPLPSAAPLPARPRADVELIDLTAADERPVVAVQVPARPLTKPTRIGSITITPVGKAAPPAAGALGSVEQLMALHMASTSLPPQMLQYMAGLPAGGKQSAGLDQLQRAQQQAALQTLMAQRMTMMPNMPGMSKEQAQANIEAYQRMLQGNFNKS